MYIYLSVETRFLLKNLVKISTKNNHLRIVVVESTDSSKERSAI